MCQTSLRDEKSRMYEEKILRLLAVGISFKCLGSIFEIISVNPVNVW